MTAPHRDGTSPIDRDELARLLPSGLDGLSSGQGRDGNSPPMDQDAWMAQMMGSLWLNTQQQQQQQQPPQHQSYGVPPHPYSSQRQGIQQAPMQFYANDSDGFRGRGGRGGRGRASGSRARGRFNDDYAAPYFPYHSPPPSSVLRSAYAIVEFKRERLKKYQCPTNIPTGEYVIVDGDRGQDCGLVVQMITNNPDGTTEINSLDGTDVDGTKLKLEGGRVLRIATEVEVSMLHNEIAALERAALKQCRARCKELGFTFEVIDCEYQFDRKKISFFFNSVHSIDFRDLVKDLYKMFGARIWMENINPGVKNTVPQGALSRHEKVAMARTRVPRAEGPPTDGTSVTARPFYPRSRPSADTGDESD